MVVKKRSYLKFLNAQVGLSGKGRQQLSLSSPLCESYREIPIRSGNTYSQIDRNPCAELMRANIPIYFKSYSQYPSSGKVLGFAL